MLAFLAKTQYSFEGKKTDESVDIFMHRHWFTLAPKIIGLLIIAIIPIFFIQKLDDAAMNLISTAIPVLFVYLIFYMIIWSVLLYKITMYLLDSWLVTNERILSNTQHGYFNRTVSEMPLSRIQDVTVNVDGVLATLFNYGNLEIQTAGAEEKFIFEEVPNPQQVKDEIMRMISMNRSPYESQNPVSSQI